MKARVRPLSEYCVVYGENIDEEKAGSLHNLVIKLKDSIFEEGAPRNLLLNEGYELKLEELPRSYLDLQNSVWNREKMIAHILYLNYAINLAADLQQPDLINYGVHDRLEDIMEEFYNRLDGLEKVQTAFENPELYITVGAYHKKLSEALDEFNLQLILQRMYHTSTIFIGDFDSEEYKLQQKIIECGIRDTKYLDLLDKAYYNKGILKFKKAGFVWKILGVLPYGKYFILEKNEVNNFLKI